MQSIREVFNNIQKHPDILFLFFLATGLTTSFFFYDQLATSAYQFGKETIGLFIPPFLSVIFMYIMGSKNNFSYKILWATLALFFMQLLPFGGLLFRTIQPNPLEDFERYMQYAQNMIQNHTLWGSDQIRFPKESKAYITQPGYRYFVALELIIFQKLYRFVSILNISIFITAIFFLFKTIHHLFKENIIQHLFSILIILSIPYATKNTLMGLTEWLTIVLLISFTWLYFIKNHWKSAFAILALIPFLRQNTLPAVTTILLLHFITKDFSWRVLIIYLSVLFIPFYHNLYYAGEVRFFVSIFKWPFLKYENTAAMQFDYLKIFKNSLHYFGFEVGKHKIDFLEEAFLFLVSFLVIYWYIGKFLINKTIKTFYYTLTLCTLFIPTVLLATDFYPRFEFIVIYFSIIMFIQTYRIQENNAEKNKLLNIISKRRLAI